MISWMAGVEGLEAAQNSQVSPRIWRILLGDNLHDKGGILRRQRQEHGTAKALMVLDLA